jgi:hypothetical protein
MWGDFEPAPGRRHAGAVFSYPVYQQLRAHNQVMEDLFAYNEDSMNATVRGKCAAGGVAWFRAIFIGAGARPQLGRAIQPSDDQSPGAGERLR